MINLSDLKKVHFTGIKGVGMTALACIGKDLGWQISGSDSSEKFVTDEVLASKGIRWEFGFDPDQISLEKPELVIYTAAHDGAKNPQVLMAKKLKIPILSQGEALGLISKTKKNRISIAGVGGKTTTTAMLATVLENSGMQPSYMVGAGKIPSLGFCGKYDLQGDTFITEADEYPCSSSDKRPKFYYQDPNILILPNLAFDHPDIYHCEAETLKVFEDLIVKMPSESLIIANGECEMIKTLLNSNQKRVIYYGFSEKNEIVIKNQIFHLGKTGFEIQSNRHTQPFAINLAGDMNVANATAVIIAARYLNIPDYQIIKGLKQYKGVARRMELVAKYKTTILMDDYAHHPDEIKASLKTIKSIYKNRQIIVIFQPHTFSRTKALFDQFSLSFNDCDKVLITNIYGSAREKMDNSISSSQLVEKINEISKNAVYIKNYGGFLDYMKEINVKNTVLVTMGAGDIFSWHGAMTGEIKTCYDRWI